MTLAAGARVGPYEIQVMIGAGGMGEVFRARDDRLGRDVAIKILPIRFSEDADRLRRFEQEARSTGKLNHPNVIAIHDVGTYEGAPYIVTELLEGENLRDRMGDSPLPLRKTAEYSLQIAKGLAAAHAKGIIHRDLKPENVYITRDGRVKILDFGLAKLIQDEKDSRESFDEPISATDSTVTLETSPGRLLGTMGYIPPEQIRDGATDHRGDIFSFGAVLFEMLTGERAFRKETNVETMNAILREDPFDRVSSTARIPTAYERIARRCLEKAPDERFQSASDLAFAIETDFGAAAAAAVEPSARGVRGGGATSRRVWLAAAGSGLAAGGLGFWAGRSWPAPRAPLLDRLTYHRGTITAARFVTGGLSVVYSARWEGGKSSLYYTRLNSLASRPLGIENAILFDLARNESSELIISQAPHFVRPGIVEGTLALTNLASVPPKSIRNEIQWAAWDPESKSAAVVRSDLGRSRLEFPLGESRYLSNGWISHPRIDPRGGGIAFIDHPALGDDRGAVMYSPHGGKVRRISGGWSSVQGLAWKPDGSEIWFTASNTGNARWLNASDLKGNVRALLHVTSGLTLHDVGADGTALVTSDSLRSRLMLIPKGDGKETELSWLDASMANDITPDGALILISEIGEGGGPGYAGYVRPVDGFPATRIGDGLATGISRDGKNVLAILQTDPPRLAILPIGAGDMRTLKFPELVDYHWADWFDSGDRIYFTANAGNAGPRLYVCGLGSGETPRAISPEGVGFIARASHDGKRVAVSGPDHHIAIYDVDAKSHRKLEDLGIELFPVQWSPDDASLYLARISSSAAQILKYDVKTGKATPFRTIAPYDPSGIVSVGPIALTPDAGTCAYTYTRNLTDLYVVKGLG